MATLQARFTGAMQTGTFGGPDGGPGAGGGFGGPGGGGRAASAVAAGFVAAAADAVVVAEAVAAVGWFRRAGGFRGQNPNAWHGTLGYSGYNNAINANSFSPAEFALPKPDRSQNSLAASFTGTPFIPHLLAPNPKQFIFISGSETRNTNPTQRMILVPTLRAASMAI